MTAGKLVEGNSEHGCIFLAVQNEIRKTAMSPWCGPVQTAHQTEPAFLTIS